MPLDEKNHKKRKISESVVEEIKKNGVKMKPPHHFMFSSFVWFGLGAIFFVISLVLLGFSVHYLSEYEFLGLISKGHFSLWFVVPILIGLVGVVSIYISSRFYRKGRICCRHEDWMLLSAIIFVLLVGLLALAKMEMFENWRDFIENHKRTQNFAISADDFWFDSDNKRISGEVIDVNRKEGYVLIQDKSGNVTKVNTKECGCEINHKNSHKGDLLKFFGESGSDFFQAKEVWGWE